jgi:hypothetical protein
MIDGDGFIEIDNAWGRQGWTKVQVEFVDRPEFLEALKSAWIHSAAKISRTFKDVVKKKAKPAKRRKNRSGRAT